MKTKIALLCLLLLNSCIKDATDIPQRSITYKSDRLYTINQGANYASGINLHWMPYTYYQTFAITPMPDCYYNLGNDQNYDINKFYGIKFGLNPEKDSFRIGWNCSKQNGKIQWYYYIHNHWIRNPAPSDDYYKTLLFESDPGVEQTFVIEYVYGLGIIRISTSGSPFMISVPFDFNGITRTCYVLFPYWGGDTKCSCVMHIRIKDKDW